MPWAFFSQSLTHFVRCVCVCDWARALFIAHMKDHNTFPEKATPKIPSRLTDRSIDNHHKEQHNFSNATLPASPVILS